MFLHSIIRNVNVTFTLHHEYAHNAVCCMSWKVKFSFGGRWRGRIGPLLRLSGSANENCSSNSKLCNFNNVLEQSSTCQAVFFQSWTLEKNSSSQRKITANIKDTKNQWKFEADHTRKKREARARSLRLILILHPIGWKECWKYCF